MGKNGSGKSSLANILTRNLDYKIVKGVAGFRKFNLLNLMTEICAKYGLFLSFQQLGCYELSHVLHRRGNQILLKLFLLFQ